MKKVAKKNVTIEDLSNTIDNLAIMVARGFEGIDKRFDKVEDRLGEVEERLERVEENLNTTRMDVLGIGDKFVSKQEFSQHLIRFSLLEQKVKAKK
ncbi:MAG: hypothetical protein WAZ40_03535 [Minisyncoccia bacterium]